MTGDAAALAAEPGARRLASTSSSPATSTTCWGRSAAGSSRRLSPPWPGPAASSSSARSRRATRSTTPSGSRCRGEERSWVEHVYLHFCTAEELEADFGAFEVLDLEERTYDEHNANGVVHRHASWFLEGRRPAG